MKRDAGAAGAPSKTIRLESCPICSRPAMASARPFCSVRCADVDLGRWLDNSYAIPVEDDELPDPAGVFGPNRAGQDESG